jgi:hypothetical protein
MAAHGRLGNKRASVVNRLFYAPGGVFAVIGNVTPDVKKSFERLLRDLKA